MDTARWYRRFGQVEARGSSPTYERLATAVADSAALIARLDRLAAPKRQPNLLFATARLLSAPLAASDAFLADVLDRWDSYTEVMSERSTQTNEPARTSAFLPLLAQIDGPITLIEVGASAGLCLYPDRYRIAYDDHPPLVGDSPVSVDVATYGPVPIPDRLPDIVERVGIDLNPLDPADPADLAWLEACVWPEHERRRARLATAAAVAAADPPRVVRANLLDAVGPAIDGAAAGTTPVVIHSAALAYVAAERRHEFGERLRERPKARWISNEAPGVVDDVATDLEPPAAARSAAYFIVAECSTATAISDPHGSWLRWRH